MIRLPLALLALFALVLAAPASEVTVPATSTVDTYVQRFNPDFLALDGKRAVTGVEHTPIFDFTPGNAATDVAKDVAHNTWFSVLVFLPFLILPQVLLLVVIFRFRDRGDGRKPATFTHHLKLEIIWTAIPVLALVVVAVPAWTLLTKMDHPPLSNEARQDPKQCTVVSVYGRQFFWEYRYNHEGSEIGLDAAQSQEPLVLAKDRVTELHLTSKDVNHAWWIPAFAVKKDCIAGRSTFTWFRPVKTGAFKGQCVELCGRDHGLMVIYCVVVDAQDYDLYHVLQSYRSAATKVVNALHPADGSTPAEAEVTAAVTAYLAKHDDAMGRFAARYWTASTLASLERKRQGNLTQEQFRSTIAAACRQRLDSLLAAAPAAQAASAAAVL